ncbi:(deoxy)nucleoside triphosphate pyrophosphohydrolase [Aestuariimicrobium ganziense]|uniref:(deoxy)nucleoside triphosphate pyrophosphohydrolase n=1 Tax=Aestuariimicrobium ganziense TaxID=2773677 RepID=UPI001940D219|nr:(deoxy)nucleoside triphosphate pyrophosphohydrolase [Aestuariimicrobium ganziense]
MARPTIVVAAGVFSRGDEVLAFRRRPDLAAGGSWEFPGGKVEATESPAQALARELEEELGCRVVVGGLVDRTTTTIGEVDIDLVVHRVEPVGQWPTTSTDHDLIRWVHRADLRQLDWAPPDLPAVAALSPGA